MSDSTSSSVDRFVLDASVALAWFLAKSEPQKRYASAVLDLIAAKAATCVVPTLFDLEVGHTLIRARRDKRLRFSARRLALALDQLDQIPTEIHLLPLNYREVIALAERYHLQGYDSIYVHLADSLGIPIATLDDGISAACRVHGIPLLTFPTASQV